MAFTTATHTSNTLVDRWDYLRAILSDAYIKHKMYRETHNELAEMTDRELADIGINRSMIKRVAMETAGYV